MKTTNSEKIKRILSGGNDVEVVYKYRDSRHVDESVVIYMSYHFEDETNSYYFVQKDGLGVPEDNINNNNSYEYFKITPLYRKPTFKVGDKVDVCEEYGGYKGVKIDSLYECFVFVEKVSKQVPFWAISMSVEQEEIKLPELDLTTPKPESLYGKGVNDITTNPDECVSEVINEGLDRLYKAKPKIEKLDFDNRSIMELTEHEITTVECKNKINEIIDHLYN